MGLEIFAVTILAGVAFVIGDTVAGVVWKAMTIQRVVIAAVLTAILLLMLLIGRLLLFDQV